MKQVSHRGGDRFSCRGTQNPGECTLGGPEDPHEVRTGCDEIRGGGMRIKNG